jgi:SAM-dependent methyltransferase
LFDDIIALSRIPPGGRILEIGCGTGQATIPFAQRGYDIHCIELGAQLAALAQRNLAPYPNAKVTTAAFETWPIEDEAYDLVISATAFHWIDSTVRYQKAVQALKPAGAIALFWSSHVGTEVSANFFQAVQAVYERIVPDMAAQFPGLSHPDTVPAPVKDEIERTGLFGDVTIHRYLWNRVYDSTSYINLLDTYSDHRSLDDATRERLFRGIAELINSQFGGQITKEHLTILYLAQRK